MVITTLNSCKNDKKVNEKQSEKTIIEEIPTTNNNGKEKESISNNVKKFSWNNIPESTVDIGAYPYITPPKGMIIDKNESESFEFDKLELFDGNSFFVIEGKVERMSIKMEGDKEWQQYLFEKSIKEYLKNIGAKLVFDGQIPYELTQKWGANPNAIYKYMHEFYAGDVVNHPISLYLLKTSNKKIGFQVSSNSRTIGVVENKDFQQTIEKITAEAIINEINSKGFISLYINFDTGKSRIKADSYETISEITKMLKANPNLKISIEGHTDNVGDETFNMKLSKNRAKTVLMSLVDEGIEESRLKSEGFGQTKPFGDNKTEEGKAQNRRVELRKI